MRVMLSENKTFDMNELPNQIDDLRYCVLDYSNQSDVDFYFIPLIFLEVYERPAVDLSIGKYRIRMPLDWSIVIGDKNIGNIEIIELKHLNGRDFDAFTMNPINGYIPDFMEISIDNIYPNVVWNLPKLKWGHILAVPLRSGENAPCAFFVRDTNKLPESLDITKIFA